MEVGVRKGFFPLPVGVFSTNGAVVVSAGPVSAPVGFAIKTDGEKAKAEPQRWKPLSALSVELRYEVIEEAGDVTRIQMVVRDGLEKRVVREIPSDEVIRFLTFLRDLEEEREASLDVTA
ncbi:MAG: hypothetical protein LBD04_09115 [Synergistaceae bacterium]|jgi:hypothetical protein|nr:hypothetical protein [Synergistaceae bacterium]